MTKAIEIRGLDRLINKIDNVQGLRAAVRALRAGAVHIKGKIAKYPPSTAANSPKSFPGRWYERGYGPRWARKDGSTGGSRKSETLGRRWTIASRNAGLTQVVGNNVSYGPYVQDKTEQNKALKSYGWKTIQDVSQEEADTIVKFVKEEIDRALSGN